MANKMQAVVAYGPRIEPGAPVHDDEFIDYLVDGTGMTEGEAKQAVANIIRGYVHFLRMGRGVYLNGFGGPSSEMHLNGRITLSHRDAPDLLDDITRDFHGVITNAENIGKSMTDLIKIWNDDPAHANDQIPTT